MPTFDAEWLQQTILALPPLLLSLTLHEYAHARVALAFGDATAQRMGRVSLNPLRHLDPIGTLMLVFSGIIGWAKPVPVNPLNFSHRRLGEIAVSAAGPLTNLLLAIIAGLLFRLWSLKVPDGLPIFAPGAEMLLWTVAGNVGLCFFNLLPLFPLDGHHIVRELLPYGKQVDFMRWQMRFGGLILLAMMLGPRLIHTLTSRPSPVDPLGLYYEYAVYPIMMFLVS
jgi:Zn-dependent protease